MCCGEKQGHESVPMMHGVCQSGAREMCGCEEKHGSSLFHVGKLNLSFPVLR